ncbi:glutamine amidotransferase family protein [Labrenzia sp. CE80]|uniref:class II glutamine amidotransferase n=1 Tax=Labrenzia sp. CE80 TaxID=1788986 RepID=UPI00129BAB68|nr:glutamine amidotransferase family protein [Labrenzia sp. CE80]
MCGIVGLFLKDKSLEPQLGQLLSDMLVTMTSRGPDSAGIAIYTKGEIGKCKITIQSSDPVVDFAGLQEDLAKALGIHATAEVKSTHAVIALPENRIDDALAALRGLRPNVKFTSSGENVEIFKEVGLPKDVAARFRIETMAGSHGIGHTRMATESAVTTNGAHPFSTGTDQCLVHNGSLSNHNNLRRQLRKAGMSFDTENDSEVAAAYVSEKLASGKSLAEALEAGLKDLDGFYTFVVGTRSGLGVLRDPIACKPAVMAETDRYVAFGSEYCALAGLPGIATARIWEPEPATVYFWEH